MEDGRALAEAFGRELEVRLGERLVAVTLFGSAARGEWIGGTSDVNVLVLLDELDLGLLELAAPAVRDAYGRGVRTLIMRREEWVRAADVFAIELADMRDAHVRLSGGDPAERLVIDPVMVRLQAEREIRAKLLHLHQGLLVSAGDRERLGQLLLSALPSFTTYLRAALRLAGEVVPGEGGAVVERGCSLVGADPAALLTVLEARRTGGRLAVGLSDPLTERFNGAGEALATYIDAFATEARREPS